MFDDFEQFLEETSPGLQPRKVPGILFRRGGHAQDWAAPGGYRYVPTGAIIQAGAALWQGAAALTGSLSQDFPAAYYGEPLLFVQVMAVYPSTAFVTARANSAGAAVEIAWQASAAVTQIHFAWIAYGGRLNG
ncbi:MAG: hypothetical protein L0Z70_16455 [Chloroflexi bacterium]|nr:hypothetical protein [Chloroflexota bacterium]